MTTDVFRVGVGDTWTGADACAVVVPGTGTPVTVSVYEPVALSYRPVLPAGTVVVSVSMRKSVVLGGTSLLTGPSVKTDVPPVQTWVEGSCVPPVKMLSVTVVVTVRAAGLVA
jgi:hypothetical protein